MTPAELQRLRELCERATPGPCRIARYDQDDGSISYQVQSEHRYGKPGDLDHRDYPVLATHNDRDAPLAKRDAELHAAAREAVPALLDEVERLRGEVASLLGRCERVAVAHIEENHADSEAGYARAVADVVAWLRTVGATYEVETPLDPAPPRGDPLYGGRTVEYFDAADGIEQGAHVGAAEKT